MMQMLNGGAAGAAGPGGGQSGLDESGMKYMQTMMEALTSGDPEIKKQMEGYWKMLDNMAESKPEEYDKFIKEQMTEMKQFDQEENKREEIKWSIQSEPYFAFSVLPAKILEHNKATPQPSQESGGIRLFDFG